MTKTIYFKSKTHILSVPPPSAPTQDTKSVTFNQSPKPLVTIEQLRERLQNYKRIFEFDDLASIPSGTWVKYIIIPTKEYKSGGILVKNNYPDKFVFKNPKTQFIWSVKLSDKAFFIIDKEKSNESREKVNDEKNELYKLYKNGKLQMKK